MAAAASRPRSGRPWSVHDEPAGSRPVITNRASNLATLSFVEAKADAVLTGPPGAGRTHGRDRLAGRDLSGRLLHLRHQPRRHGPQPQGSRGSRTPDEQNRLPLRPGILVVSQVGTSPSNARKRSGSFRSSPSATKRTPSSSLWTKPPAKCTRSGVPVPRSAETRGVWPGGRGISPRRKRRRPRKARTPPGPGCSSRPVG